LRPTLFPYTTLFRSTHHLVSPLFKDRRRILRRTDAAGAVVGGCAGTREAVGQGAVAGPTGGRGGGGRRRDTGRERRGRTVACRAPVASVSWRARPAQRRGVWPGSSVGRAGD